jgi:tRNA (cmo5U34)-methyltransferase
VRDYEGDYFVSDDLIDDSDYVQPHVTFYMDGEGRWLKRVWAVQCPEAILFRERPDGSYHYKPHETDPKRKKVGCGMIPPGSSGYRTPLEMSRYR